MGSTSVTEPAPAVASNSLSDSLNGLKFGQKIYFEDVGLGAPAKSSGGAPKKGRGCGVQGAQPPRCQVEGCRVDLSDAKAYYSRHKVCSMHSKSPRVVVAGQEQRFCQQCSRRMCFCPMTRFHQLSEFDQVKRSCRRRLAGHNERRRKPPPSSLLASRYGRLGAPNFDSSSRGGGGGFVMEFATFPKLSLRNAIGGSPTSCEQVGGGSVTVPWQGNCESPSSLVFLQAGGGGGCSSPVGGTSFCGSRNSSSGESFAGGMTDSSCALSLLSNQAWAPRNRAPSLGMNNFMSFDDTTSPITQLAAPSSHHGPSIHHHHHHHLSNASWCFKGVDGSGDEIVPDLGLGHHISSHPMSSPLPGEIDVSQQGRRHYMDVEQQSRAYDDSQLHMNWSL